MSAKVEISPAMASNSWFGGLPESDRLALLAAGERLNLRMGEMLYRQGDTPGGFFGVVSGSFKVSTLREDGKEGILAVIEAGNWFGETSVFDQLPHPHDATALESAEVLVVGRTAFEGLTASPTFARAMSVLLSSQVRLLYGLIEDVLLRSTNTRVARRLMALVRGDATLAWDCRTVVPVLQEQLAMMLGMSRQTLSKELKALERDGVLLVGYRRIEICSLAALESRSKLG